MQAHNAKDNWLYYYEQQRHLAVLLSYFPRDERVRKEIEETEKFLDNFIEEKLNGGNDNTSM